jgi:hydrogenase maturation protease
VKASARDRTLVACIGNIFLGDDGFGCEVARELGKMELPGEVKVVDYGIRGLDLAYALLERCGAVIFVDAVTRGGRPGTIYLLQCVDTSSDIRKPTALDPHSMEPANLLAMARSLGEVTSEIYIVGCEPTDFGDELVGRMGLSDAVMTAVPEAARAVVDLITRIATRDGQGTGAICASK